MKRFIGMFLLCSIVLGSVFWIGKCMQPEIIEIEVVRKIYIPKIVEYVELNGFRMRKLTEEECSYYNFTDKDDNKLDYELYNVTYNSSRKTLHYIDRERDWIICGIEKIENSGE